MNRLRFSLTRLLVSVSLLAVACAALLTPSEFWAAVACGLAMLLLATATLAALVRQGPARAFWIGCAVFGWGYLYFGYETPSAWQYQSRTAWLGYDSNGLARNLPTTRLLTLIYDYTARAMVSVGTEVEVEWTTGAFYPGTVTQIAAEAAFATRRDVNRVRRDVRSLGFKVDLPADAAGAYPGLTAYVHLPAPGGR